MCARCRERANCSYGYGTRRTEGIFKVSTCVVRTSGRYNCIRWLGERPATVENDYAVIAIDPARGFAETVRLTSTG
jgi:hypothetical protein